MSAHELYVGYNGKFYNLLSSYTKNSVSNQFFNSLALVFYLQTSRIALFSNLIEIPIISSLTTCFSWNNLDNLWSGRFLHEARKLGATLDEKVHFFLFCKGRVTP